MPCATNSKANIVAFFDEKKRKSRECGMIKVEMEEDDEEGRIRRQVRKDSNSVTEMPFNKANDTGFALFCSHIVLYVDENENDSTSYLMHLLAPPPLLIKTMQQIRFEPNCLPSEMKSIPNILQNTWHNFPAFDERKVSRRIYYHYRLLYQQQTTYDK